MTRMQTFLNIAANSIKRHNLNIMLGKLYLRLSDYRHARQAKEAAAWAKGKAESWNDFANSLDPALWEEAQGTCRNLKQKAQAKLDKLGLDLGGGGHYPMLYFMTRYAKARTVVETGVAAGWSSLAILTALRDNGQGGYLYSSDFPYFRLKNPEQYVGYVVDDELKSAWTLMIDGDRNNLPRMAAQTRDIDLFHYDSDKSYTGRCFAMACLEKKLSPRAAVMFDDIQDNFHFRDFVQARGWPYKIFSFEGKYTGLTGPFLPGRVK